MDERQNLPHHPTLKTKPEPTSTGFTENRLRYPPVFGIRSTGGLPAEIRCGPGARMLEIGNERLDDVFREAMGCSDCFKAGQLRRSLIDIAQPRWIGSGYASATPRILIITTNPGAGENRRDSEDQEFRSLLHAYYRKEIQITPVFAHQLKDMKNWNKLLSFYIDGFGLHIDFIALANIAWCGTLSNEYPTWMLRHCYQRHTSREINLLEPDLIILGGAEAGLFERYIQGLIPSAKIVQTLHFAHRKGKLEQSREVARLQAIISQTQAELEN